METNIVHIGDALYLYFMRDSKHTTKTPAPESAAAKYAEIHGQAERLLKALQTKLRNHARAQQGDPNNWTYVADLVSMVERLGYIENPEA